MNIDFLEHPVFGVDVDESYLDSLTVPEQIEYIRRVWSQHPEYMSGALRDWLRKQPGALRTAIIAFNPLAPLMPLTTSVAVGASLVSTFSKEKEQREKISELEKELETVKAVEPLEPTAAVVPIQAIPDIGGLFKNPLVIGGALLAVAGRWQKKVLIYWG